MSIEELIRLIISFLGGGLIAGILNWIRSSVAERKSRQIEFLSLELRNLYGPLFFFVSQNDNMFKLNSTFQRAYSAEYVDQEWSEDNHTQNAVRKDATKTLDVANRYIVVVKQNNHKIVEIMTNNYEYIDPDDVETFQQFLVDHARINTEIDNEGNLETPFMIYKRVGDISFMRPELIQRVRTKFYKKKRELDDLHR